MLPQQMGQRADSLPKFPPSVLDFSKGGNGFEKISERLRSNSAGISGWVDSRNLVHLFSDSTTTAYADRQNSQRAEWSFSKRVGFSISGMRGKDVDARAISDLTSGIKQALISVREARAALLGVAEKSGDERVQAQRSLNKFMAIYREDTLDVFDLVSKVSSKRKASDELVSPRPEPGRTPLGRSPLHPNTPKVSPQDRVQHFDFSDVVSPKGDQKWVGESSNS